MPDIDNLLERLRNPTGTHDGPPELLHDRMVATMREAHDVIHGIATTAVISLNVPPAIVAVVEAIVHGQAASGALTSTPPAAVHPPATIAELEAILNTPDDPNTKVNIRPDGSIERVRLPDYVPPFVMRVGAGSIGGAAGGKAPSAPQDGGCPGVLTPDQPPPIADPPEYVALREKRRVRQAADKQAAAPDANAGEMF